LKNYSIFTSKYTIALKIDINPIYLIYLKMNIYNKNNTASNKIIFKHIKIHIHVQLPKNVAKQLQMKIENHKQTCKIRNDKYLEKIKQEKETNILYSSATNKTKKKKLLLSVQEKKDLWKRFDIDKPKTKLAESISDNPMISYEHHKETTICNACNGYIMIMEDGFPTCNSCGIIDMNVLDYSPEWRFYGAEDKHGADPTRCGNPINPLLLESSFGCKIMCTAGSSYDMKKIRTWTEWQSMPHREKSLYDEFQFITQMAQNSGIPKIFIDNAIQIHKTISERKMLRGLNRDGIKAASIYLSCRKNGCPRTAHEIADIFHLDKASATNGCSMAVNILNDIERTNGNQSIESSKLCFTTPCSFIERYCSKLNMSVEIVKLAMFVAKKIELGHLINDNAPDSIAAGIVYFISQLCKLNYTKFDIKGICGVSEVTINKCFKKLNAIREMVIPTVILQKYQYMM